MSRGSYDMQLTIDALHLDMTPSSSDNGDPLSVDEEQSAWGVSPCTDPCPTHGSGGTHASDTLPCLKIIPSPAPSLGCDSPTLECSTTAGRVRRHCTSSCTPRRAGSVSLLRTAARPSSVTAATWQCASPHPGNGMGKVVAALHSSHHPHENILLAEALHQKTQIEDDVWDSAMLRSIMSVAAWVPCSPRHKMGTPRPKWSVGKQMLCEFLCRWGCWASQGLMWLSQLLTVLMFPLHVGALSSCPCSECPLSTSSCLSHSLFPSGLMGMRFAQSPAPRPHRIRRRHGLGFPPVIDVVNAAEVDLVASIDVLHTSFYRSKTTRLPSSQTRPTERSGLRTQIAWSFILQNRPSA